jgi:Flp pilus assembly protein TadD
VEQAPKELEFWYADILVSWEGKDYKSLKKALKAAKSLGGDTDIIRRFTILNQARTSEDLEGNITLLQNAIRSLGPEPELMYALGEAYLKAGLLEEARSWFKKTVSLKGLHENAWLGEIAALEALLVSDHHPASPGPKRSKSAGQIPATTAEELGALYEAYLDQWPDNSNIRRDRALFLVKTFEYEKAAPELEKLLVWEPSNSSLRRVLAYTYRKTGRYREAAVFLKSLLKEKPKDTELLIEYSGCLERAGAIHYAVAVLEKARELFESLRRKPNASGKPGNPKPSDGRGRKPDIIRQSDIANISLALGILNFRQKNVEKAFDCLREAAAINTSDPRPYEWMAIIARKNGDPGDGGYYEKEAQKRKKAKK